MVLSRVGGDKCAPAANCRAESTHHWLVGRTFKSEALVRVPKENLQCGQTRSIGRPNTVSLPSARGLSHFRHSDAGTLQVYMTWWICFMAALRKAQEMVRKHYL